MTQNKRLHYRLNENEKEQIVRMAAEGGTSSDIVRNALRLFSNVGYRDKVRAVTKYIGDYQGTANRATRESVTVEANLRNMVSDISAAAGTDYGSVVATAVDYYKTTQSPTKSAVSSDATGEILRRANVLAAESKILEQEVMQRKFTSLTESLSELFDILSELQRKIDG